MSPIAGTVLKRSRIRPGPPRPIGRAAPAPTGPPATARIVQQDADGALVEVACPCGKTIRLRCLFEAPPAQGAPASPAGAPEPV